MKGEIRKNNIECISDNDDSKLYITLTFSHRYSFPKNSKTTHISYTILFDINTNLPIGYHNMSEIFYKGSGRITKENIEIFDVLSNETKIYSVIKYYNKCLNNDSYHSLFQYLNIYDENKKIIFGCRLHRGFNCEYYQYYDEKYWKYKIFNMYPYDGKYLKTLDESRSNQTKENFNKMCIIYLKYLSQFIDYTNYTKPIPILAENSGCDYECQKITKEEIFKNI